MVSIIDPEKLKQAYNKLCTTKNHIYSYGTAGFRDKALYLDTVIFTTAISACIRSIELKGSPIGVMITASHNPPEDNGVKIIEPRGEMLVSEWESIATTLANLAGSAGDNYNEFESYIFKELLPKRLDGLITTPPPPLIVLGHDSRESSPRLTNCFLETMKIFSFNCAPVVINHGLVTTPQLHFLTFLETENRGNKTKLSYRNYESYFYEAWSKVCDLYGLSFDIAKQKNQKQCTLPFDRLVVDCANGVGSLKFKQFLADCFPEEIVSRFQFINDDWEHPELLNRGCGADYVKTNQCLPRGLDPTGLNNTLCCSFDGDADRIVFYFVDEQKQFKLLDGDRIATLLAKFFQLQQTQQKLQDILKLGVVQTAYANGSSTKYLTDTLHCPVTCTKTGVKHLHHAAQQNYDIGVYFEANGHGTVLFSEKFYTVCKQSSASSTCRKLMAFSKLINSTVGDAMSDLLAVILALSILKWTPARWYEEYTDLPNKLTKVVVPDRTVDKTTNEERTLVSPEGVQTRIDNLVSQIKSGRTFVRPSGTEDAVRVYCEGADASEVEWLSEQISGLLT